MKLELNEEEAKLVAEAIFNAARIAEDGADRVTLPNLKKSRQARADILDAVHDRIGKGMKAPRKVRIEASPRKAWFVSYVDRKPGQKRNAAIFDMSQKTLEQVKQWVDQNPKISLVD